MNLLKKKHIILTVIAILLVIPIGVKGMALAQPGSEDDPLVTLSFVEKRIEQVKFYVEEKLIEVTSLINKNNEEISRLTKENNELKNQIKGLSGSGEGQTSQQLEVVELRNGQSLIASAGSEIILRGGKATAIAAELGGLSDVTAAVDIQKGQNIPANHLLIIPRNDGRGVYAKEYAIFMVRGSYEIK